MRPELPLPLPRKLCDFGPVASSLPGLFPTADMKLMAFPLRGCVSIKEEIYRDFLVVQCLRPPHFQEVTQLPGKGQE